VSRRENKEYALTVSERQNDAPFCQGFLLTRK
jgi:hypothetical protein